MPKERSKLQRHRAEKATVGDFYAADVSCSLLSHIIVTDIHNSGLAAVNVYALFFLCVAYRSFRNRKGGVSKFSVFTMWVCGSVAEWLGRWTCDHQVASSNPGLPTVECNLGKLLTHMCLCHQAV